MYFSFDFKGIIDYIFYSKQSMTPLGLLGPLSSDWFRENKVVGCPHPHIPSGNNTINYCNILVTYMYICNIYRSLPIAGRT